MRDFKRHLLRAAKCLGLFRLSRRLTRRSLRILCYHGVWLDETRPNPFNFLYMRPQRFARRMQLLARSGHPVLGLDEALRRMRDGTLPPAAVVITIDDGWYGTYAHMVPELQHHGFPATIYLTTHHAERGTSVFGVALQHVLQSAPLRALDWPLDASASRFDLDDVEQRAQAHRTVSAHAESLPDAEARENLLRDVATALGYDWAGIVAMRQFRLMSLAEAANCAERGIDFQLHTHRHRVSHGGSLCIAEELQDNRARLSKVSQRAATHFCYPSGNWHRDHFAALQAAGVVSATTTDNGFCSATSEPLALPRILDGDRVSEIEFEAELNGVMEIKRRILRALSLSR